MRKHEIFILSPLFVFLKEFEAIIPKQQGIEFTPLTDYLLQSLFLKMTGALEQKLKCILWELATDDYEFRYEYLSKREVGECSSYNDKSYVYKKMAIIVNKNSNYDRCSKSIGKTKSNNNRQRNGNKDAISDIIDKKDRLKEVLAQCELFFRDGVIKSWQPREFQDYMDFVSLVLNDIGNELDNSATIFVPKGKLFNAYEATFRHRNRCAHNLLSYQNNNMRLKVLSGENGRYENWFIRFMVLMFIDDIFVESYKKYLSSSNGYY